MANEARMSKEKATKAMIDTGRLAEELRAKQELAAALSEPAGGGGGGAGLVRRRSPARTWA